VERFGWGGRCGFRRTRLGQAEPPTIVEGVGPLPNQVAFAAESSEKIYFNTLVEDAWRAHACGELKELRAGDRVYCMPCMSRLELVEEGGLLVAKVIY
jgi:hypothetical protein